MSKTRIRVMKKSSDYMLATTIIQLENIFEHFVSVTAIRTISYIS